MGEKQGSFVEVDPTWGYLLAPVNQACQEVHAKVTNLLNRYKRLLPPLSELDLEKGRVVLGLPDQTIKLIPQSSNTNNPRICDLDVPYHFILLLQEYIKRSGREKFGHKTYLPNPPSLTFGLYEWTEIPVTLERDTSGLLPRLQDYTNWYQQVLTKWRLPTHWDIFVDLSQQNKNYNFSLSAEGEVEEFLETQNLPPMKLELGRYKRWALEKLETVMRFADGQLTYLWQEELNGTFFQDPRGGKDMIWPHWVRNRQRPNKKKPATAQDWQTYLAAIRRGEPVVSGASLKPAKMTKKRAETYLELWRDFLYYQRPQVFNFHHSKLERGHTADLGYRYIGKYECFLAKKIPGYQRLSAGKTIELLSSWEP